MGTGRKTAAGTSGQIAHTRSQTRHRSHRLERGSDHPCSMVLVRNDLTVFFAKLIRK
jgi:hypothetical protein